MNRLYIIGDPKATVTGVKHMMVESGIVPELSTFLNTYGWEYLQEIWDEATQKEFIRLWNQDDQELLSQLLILQKFSEVCSCPSLSRNCCIRN